MSEERPAGIDYAGLVTAALRGVLRVVLEKVAASGFPGEHHLFISFRTDHAAVGVPARLRKEHPQEMTIVLQHQFWGLAVDDDGFSVQLRFGGVLESLVIPWDAVVAFADPSGPFGLRFGEIAEPAAAGNPTGEEVALEPKDEEPHPPADPKVVAFRPAPKGSRARTRKPSR